MGAARLNDESAAEADGSFVAVGGVESVADAFRETLV